MAILRIIALYISFVVVFALQKVAFLFIYPPAGGPGAFWEVWIHGLSMELSMAA